MFLTLTSLCLLFAFIDLVPIFREKKWKLFVIYSLLLLTALVTGVLYSMNVKLFSPANPIRNLVQALWGLESGE